MFFQTALVTGANGFIGGELCRTLKAQNIHVRALIRREAAGSWDDIFLADLAVDEIPREAMKNVDIVFHLAGKVHALHEIGGDEIEYQRLNVEGTRKLIAAAKDARVKRFVFFSSVKAMGEGGNDCLVENIESRPGSPYGRSKLAAEQLVLHGDFIPEPVVIRLSMVYGPSRYGNLPRMIKAVLKGRFPFFPEVGNKRSMVHLEDVIQAAILTGNHPDAVGQTYIITDGQEYSTRQILEWIYEVMERPVPQWQIPIGVLKLLARVGDGISRLRGRRFIFDSTALEKLIGSAWYSSDKINRELGFQAKNNLKDSLPGIIAHLGD